ARTDTTADTSTSMTTTSEIFITMSETVTEMMTTTSEWITTSDITIPATETTYITYTTTGTTDTISTTETTESEPVESISVAAGGVEISLEELRENDFQVSVPIEVTANPGFCQLAFGASWDTTYLTLESCESDAENLVFTSDVNETDGNSVWLSFMSMEMDANGNLLNYTGTALCTLTFTVSEDAQPGDMYAVYLDHKGTDGGTAGAESDEALTLKLIPGFIVIAPEMESDTSTTETTGTTNTTEETTTTATMTGTTDATTDTSATMSADTTTNTTASGTTETTTVTTPTSINVSGLYIMLGKPDESQLYVGNSFHLLYATNAKNLIWKSTDESIATVDENGVLTILDSGTVSVIVIVQEDPIQTDTITIVIPEAAETTNTTADTSGSTNTSTTPTTTTTTGTPTETGLRGDVDLDGDVDADDAYQVLVYYARHSVGDTAYTFQGNAALEAQVVQQADVNQSGTVDADDAYLILCYYARISVGITDIRWEDLI
ncbi:MAG: hypothetical protein ACI4XB_03165, partial [Ruminococcus sp.]